MLQSRQGEKTYLHSGNPSVIYDRRIVFGRLKSIVDHLEGLSRRNSNYRAAIVRYNLWEKCGMLYIEYKVQYTVECNGSLFLMRPATKCCR